MITRYLLILGIAHILGDFYFQNEKMARYKDEKYKGVLLHCLEYYLVAVIVILPVFSTDMFLSATCSAFLHFVIDTAKYMIQIKKKVKRKDKIFIADQCAHAISLFMIAYFMDCLKFSIDYIGTVKRFFSVYGCDTEMLARWILAVLTIHIPANIFIQKFLEVYRPKSDSTIIKADNRVGRVIGSTERLIMLIFLSQNQYAAIGFILTAKSIARYDKIAKDEKFAEYYLLGTLVSTLCVIMCRMLIL